MGSHTIIQRPHHTCPPSPSSSQHLRPSPSDYTLLVLAGPPTWIPWMRHGIAKQTRPHDGKSSWRPLKHDAAGWRHPIASKLSSDSARRLAVPKKDTEAPEELIYELLTEKGMSAVFMRQHDLAKRRSETWNEMAIFSKLKPPKKKSTFVEAQIARS